MPSKNPSIAVRLPPAMYRQVRERAAAEHRSLSNFVEHALRRLFGPDNEVLFKQIEADELAGRDRPAPRHRRSRPQARGKRK